MVKDGWKRYSTAEIGTFAKGSGISREQSDSGNLPAVRYGELYTTHNYYIREFASHISSDVALQAHKIGYGDLLFTCSGETKEEIGKCVAVVTNTEAYAGGDLIIITPTCKMHPLFMGYALNTPQVIHQRAQLAQGDSIVHISTESIKSLEFDAPEYPEQCRIAEVLSDIDEFIINLEKLIDKKMDMRKGAMQELMTGKRRLPGFQEEWVEKSLLDYVSLVQGLTYTPDRVKPFGTLVLRSSNIKNHKLILEDNVYVDMPVSQEKMIQDGDILVCVRNGSSALIGKSCVLKEMPYTTFGAFMAVLRGDKTGYIAKAFESDIVQSQIRDRSSATINQITKQDFEDIRIYMPPTEEEKEAIADTLSAMENEIDALELKRDKMIQIKSGAMDVLLTGKTRLVCEEVQQ